MTIRHAKGPGVIARGKLYCSQERHYLFIYLWESLEKMRQGSFASNGVLMDYPDGRLGGKDHAIAHFSPCDVWLADGSNDEIPHRNRPLIGELHFVSGEWNEEVVGHELMHAALHKMRCLEPRFDKIRDQSGTAEEEICLEVGEWFRSAWEFLWVNDPKFEI